MGILGNWWFFRNNQKGEGLSPACFALYTVKALKPPRYTTAALHSGLFTSGHIESTNCQRSIPRCVLVTGKPELTALYDFFFFFFLLRLSWISLFSNIEGNWGREERRKME